MKDLIIPTQVENGINISYIGEDFKGIIIIYKFENPIGCITMDNEENIWFASNSIKPLNSVMHLNYSTYESDSLIGLCNELIDDNIATNFKVIEFK